MDCFRSYLSDRLNIQRKPLRYKIKVLFKFTYFLFKYNVNIYE